MVEIAEAKVSQPVISPLSDALGVGGGADSPKSLCCGGQQIRSSRRGPGLGSLRPSALGFDPKRPNGVRGAPPGPCEKRCIDM